MQLYGITAEYMQLYGIFAYSMQLYGLIADFYTIIPYNCRHFCNYLVYLHFLQLNGINSNIS